MAALGKRTPTPLGVGDEMDAGGTWVMWSTNSSSKPIKAVFDVGVNRPKKTPEGVDYIPGAMATIESDFNTQHVLWYGSPVFQPEADYWGALLLMTEDDILAIVE